ncbi:Cys-tRNA(Pro) deacylase [Raoultibacter massiliensis]|uniref:Cys-tRNA(Pro)/Cys-tRNA(Cys) deacylase n=1 Tax=Raoultibacter massiliensis TaxID=1852371 RepID=A0ABV1JBH4_9ACTN|nr:Cys-tRNA(Pro) deacylase [Raoultibacter massiliensis]
MAKPHDQKTNAMRVLDAAGIEYVSRMFECPEALSGIEVARLLDLEPERVFKTLVTEGRSGEHYVFMIPVAEELDLKKAATAVKEKSIAMIKSKELLPLTGYVHGGCSPIGMKKAFTTVADETAILFDRIVFSGGRIGTQIEASIDDLSRVLAVSTADLTV